MLLIFHRRNFPSVRLGSKQVFTCKTDILCRVVISVVDRHTLWTDPSPYRQGQRIKQISTDMTQLGRGEKSVQLQIRSAVPPCLVGKLAEYFSPRSIADRFCQTMVLEHIGNRQPLNKNGLVFAYGFCRELVQIVLTGVYDLCVHLCKRTSCLAAIVTAFDFAAQSALADLHSSLFSLQEARIRKPLASAQC